jgi:hypothetical protein
MKQATRMILWGFSFLTAVWVAPTTYAQNETLKAELNTARAELRSLEVVMNTLNTSDSSYIVYFPTWMVLDKYTKTSIFSAFRNRGKSFVDDDLVYVIASPDERNIIDLRIGNISYGRLYAQSILDPDLKRELLDRDYAYENETPAGYKTSVQMNRRPLPRPATPEHVAFNLSAFSGYVRFSNDWGIVGQIGDDELGYPFWSSGQVRMMASYKSLKLGAWLPLHGGLKEIPVAGSLKIRPRLLNGSGGVAGEFEFEWDAVKLRSPHVTYTAVGGSFAVGGLTKRRPELLTSNLDSLYSLSTVLQAYYALDYAFDDDRHRFTIHLGGTYHRVTLNSQRDGGIQPSGPTESFVNPLLSFEYKNQRIDWFRLSAQYSRLLMVGAWAEIIPYFVFAEVKFSSVVGRDPKPWEYPSYLYGTLGINFDF